VKNKKGKDRDKEESLKKKHNKENSKKSNDNRMGKKTEKIVMPLSGVIISRCKTNDV
jgi:septal ring factor EnvC (AmiA/AmiB activator)